MFRFKKFVVHQDRCAMKVSTDSILFGSWCNPGQSKNILDIGTGTGILSLMLAQKTPDSTNISAIEIDSDAFEQAKANVAASPWSVKINIFHRSLQDFVEVSDSKFDMIISNPPWFEFAPSQAHNADNQQRDAFRTLARQQLGLTLDVLISHTVDLLKSDGDVFLILPVQAEKALRSNLEKQELSVDRPYVHKMAKVFATAKHAAYCHLWHLKKGINQYIVKEPNKLKTLNKVKSETIVIKQEDNQYTTQFKQMCKDFYLNF